MDEGKWNIVRAKHICIQVGSENKDSYQWRGKLEQPPLLQVEFGPLTSSLEEATCTLVAALFYSPLLLSAEQQYNLKQQCFMIQI